MNTQLKEFETYITALVERGVFPAFERNSYGWICILKNRQGIRLMPLDNNETCWGQTMMNALVTAVESLNALFVEPEELLQYIDKGEIPKSDFFKIVNAA